MLQGGSRTLHDLAEHVSWFGSVPYRSCTTSSINNSKLGSRLSICSYLIDRSWFVRRVCVTFSPGTSATNATTIIHQCPATYTNISQQQHSTYHVSYQGRADSTQVAPQEEALAFSLCRSLAHRPSARRRLRRMIQYGDKKMSRYNRYMYILYDTTDNSSNMPRSFHRSFPSFPPMTQNVIKTPEHNTRKWLIY